MNPRRQDLIEGIKNRVSQASLDKLILNVSGQINFLDGQGKSPLHYAVETERNKETFEKLLALEPKPNINIVDSNKNTPLHYAISGLKDDKADALLNAGADTTIQNASGDTPVHLFAKRGAQGGGAELFSKYSVAMKRSIYIQNNLKQTPLHCAIIFDNLYFFTFFIKPLAHRYYEDINLSDPAILHGPDGDNLVHTAIKRLKRQDLEDNIDRTYTMLYLLASAVPEQFNQWSGGRFSGYTPQEMVNKIATANELDRIKNIVQHPYEVYRQTVADKELLGVLQCTLNGLRDENNEIKKELKEVKSILKNISLVVIPKTPTEKSEVKQEIEKLESPKNGARFF